MPDLSAQLRASLCSLSTSHEPFRSTDGATPSPQMSLAKKQKVAEKWLKVTNPPSNACCLAFLEHDVTKRDNCSRATGEPEFESVLSIQQQAAKQCTRPLYTSLAPQGSLLELFFISNAYMDITDDNLWSVSICALRCMHARSDPLLPYSHPMR